jgi:hypothetical protein
MPRDIWDVMSMLLCKGAILLVDQRMADIAPERRAQITDEFIVTFTNRLGELTEKLPGEAALVDWPEEGETGTRH